jgi:chromate reductase
MFRVAVLVASNRATSNNLRFARALEKLSAGRLAFDYLDVFGLPFYDDALWNDPPEAVIAFKQRIEQADAVLFVTPEYNRSIPGVLKNAIDWPSRPYGESVWSNKPAAIAGATGGVGGTAAAQAHLRSILPVLGVALMGAPEVYFQSRPGAIDENLAFTDERIRTNLNIWVDRFGDWIGRFARQRTTADELPSIRAAS